MKTPEAPSLTDALTSAVEKLEVQSGQDVGAEFAAAPQTEQAHTPNPDPASATPEPAAEPSAPRKKLTPEEQAEKMRAYFDKEYGPEEDAERQARAMRGERVEEPAATAKNEPAAPASAADPAATPEPPKPAARRRRKAADTELPAEGADERIARIAGETAARVVQQTQAPRAPEAPPKEDYLADDEEVQEMLTQLRVLEQMDPKKQGAADKYIKALKEQESDHKKRTQEYAAQWRRDNPGKTFKSDSDEHAEFFTELEEEPLPDIGVTERDLKRAEHKIIEDRVAQRFEAKEQELDRRLRATEHKEDIRNTASAAVKTVQTALGIPDISKADAYAVPIVKDATNRAARFAHTTYAVMTGLEPKDDNNRLHQQIKSVTDLLRREMGQKPAEETEIDGKTYVDPYKFHAMRPPDQARYWTINHQDVIDYGTSIIAEQAKAQVAAREKELQEFAEKRGWKPNGEAKPKPAAVAVTTRPIARNGGDEPAPTFGSERISQVPGGGAPAPAKKGLAAFWDNVIERG